MNLIFLLFILLRQLNNVAAISTLNDFNCLNDGFATDANCTCRPYFTGAACRTVQCLNEGHPDADKRKCICPAGFLGDHCEPVKCVAGESGSFALEANKRQLVIIFTYNFALRRLMEKDGNVIQELCEQLSREDLATVEMVVPTDGEPGELTIDKYACNDEESSVEDYFKELCGEPPGTDSCNQDVSTAIILAKMKEMSRNSRLLIITNSGIGDVNNTEGLAAIRKLASAMHIQIHSLAHSPEKLGDLDTYNEPAYAALHDLATSTLGFFITPYAAVGNNLRLGRDGMTKVVKSLFTLFFDASVIATESGEGSILYFKFKSDANVCYIAVRGNDIYSPNFDTIIMGAESSDLTVDTGFWKLYTVTVTKGSSTTLAVLNSNPAVNADVYILSKIMKTAHVAVTTYYSVDASSPFVPAGKKSELVAYIPNSPSLDDLMVSVDKESSFELTENDYKARNCQYNVRLASVSCNGTGTTSFIKLSSKTDGSISVAPIHCISENSTSSLSSIYEEPLPLQDSPQESSIESEAINAPVEIKDSRSLSIIMHRTEADMKIFLTKAGLAAIFKRLSGKGHFGSYVWNFYTNDNTERSALSATYQDFVKGFADASHEDVDSSSNCTADFADVAMLVDLSHTEIKPFSDVILLVDHSFYFDDNLFKFIQYFYKKRLRLFTFIIGCEEESSASLDSSRSWQRNAALTGGFSIQLNTSTDFRDTIHELYEEKGLYDNALVAAMDAELGPGSTPFSITTTKFYYAANTTYLVAVYSSPLTSSIKLGESTIESVKTYGTAFTLFTLNNGSNTIVDITALPDTGLYLIGSIRVFEVKPEHFTTLAFNRGNIEPYPIYNPPGQQSPVIDAPPNLSVKFTLINSVGSIIKEENMTEKVSASFSYRGDFSWKCADYSSLFYLVTTVTTSDETKFTRCVVTRCFSQSGPGPTPTGTAVPPPTPNPCLHDGKANSDGSCICTLHWSGDLCQIPLCLNGGVVTPSNECDCSSTQYSGLFCQNYNGTCNADKSSLVPEFRSLITSVIFVVERSPAVAEALNSSLQSSEFSWRTAQFIVVTYGNERIGTRITSHPAEVYTLLTSVESEEEFVTGNEFTALREAISLQATPSSLLIWIAQNTTSLHGQNDLLAAVAVNRVILRGVFLSGSNDDYNMTSSFLSAGGSFAILSETNITKYFEDYLGNLLTEDIDRFEPRLNVLLATTNCSSEHIIPIDATTTAVVVSAPFGVKINISNTECDNAHETNKFIVCAVSGGPRNITIHVDHNDLCFWTVEAINKDQIAFGFVVAESSSDILAAPPPGVSHLVTYITGEQPTEDVSATVSKIMTSGLETAPVRQTMTLRNNSCTFRYSLPINCSEDIAAYSIIMHTALTPPRSTTPNAIDKHITAYCLRFAECLNEGTWKSDGSCDCGDSWVGSLCEFPKECKNGGTRLGSVCQCLPGYNGAFCENQGEVPPDPTQRAFLLLQDICGGAALSSTTDDIVLEYAKLVKYDTSTHVMLATNARDGAVVNVTSADQVKTQMDVNRKSSSCSSPSDSDYTNAFTEYLNLVRAVNLARSNTSAIHATQTGITYDNDALDELKQQYDFKLASVGITEKHKIFSTEAEISLSAAGPFMQTYDSYQALKFLSNNFKPDLPLPPQKRQPGCAHQVEASFLVATDVSNLPANHKDTIAKVLKIFFYDFNKLPGHIPITDPPECKYDETQLANKTSFVGTFYCDSKVANPNVIFCSPDDLDNFFDNLAKNRSLLATQNMTSVVSRYAQNFKNNVSLTCRCVRPDMKKNIMLWIPISGISTDTDHPLDLAGKISMFNHIVLPFFDVSGTIWQNESNYTLPNSVGRSVNEIVQDLWTHVCRINGEIEPSWTAEPPPESEAMEILESQYRESEIAPHIQPETPFSKGIFDYIKTFLYE